MAQRDDRLARLAEAHVVGEDRALAAEQEGDAFDLVREQPLGQRRGAAKRLVGIVWRESEQPSEGVCLRVEGFITIAAASVRRRARPEPRLL